MLEFNPLLMLFGIGLLSLDAPLCLGVPEPLAADMQVFGLFWRELLAITLEEVGLAEADLFRWFALILRVVLLPRVAVGFSLNG